MDYQAWIGPAIIITIMLIAGYAMWVLSGRPISNEADLLRRIYQLEIEVDKMAQCKEQLETLQQQVEFLRAENRDLILTVAKMMRRDVTGKEIDDEVSNLHQQLRERRRNLESIDNRLATYPSGQAPTDIQTQHDREAEAIASLERRIDLFNKEN